MNSIANNTPATSPASRVASLRNSGMPRHRAHKATIIAAPVDRTVAWVSGGISGMASLTATWFTPQLRHNTTVTTIATLSSGRADGVIGAAGDLSSIAQIPS